MLLSRAFIVAFGMLSQPAESILLEHAGHKVVALSNSGNCETLGINTTDIAYRVSKEPDSGNVQAVVTSYNDRRDLFGLPFNGCAKHTHTIPQPGHLLKIDVVRKGYEREFGTRVVSDIYYQSLSLTR